MTLKTALCRYRYDPLDRLASRSLLAEAVSRLFYQADRLASELQGSEQHRFFHRDRQPLACHTLIDNVPGNTLTATDQQNSVLNALNGGQPVAVAYTPYGHHAPAAHLPGYLGEKPDPVTGHYLLGNGYRAYNPVLMRFNSPDSLSPFGKGGLNAYAYCAGDPLNRSDSSGHDWLDIALSAAYIGAGLATAGFGLAMARPSLKAVFKGVKTKPPATDVSPASPAPRRSADTGEKLSAVVAVGAVAASVVWGSAFIVKNAAPDSPLQQPLAAIAVALSLSTLVFRGGNFARTEIKKRTARPATVASPSPSPSRRSIGVQTSYSIRSRSSSVRDDLVEETRL
ncbi:RHS repeat-associated core domain-containing protein [Pseudomonas floridensis]|uniref:RHS repeat-associated core domain-containing protein n=2 Tax=Pseudomonas floridensis TaxID=1958950 RepID=A0A1X0N7A7_9PSED|nr:RHS repeat-associated core domain-containing protein [Pseudomonas floridensis]